MVASGDIGWVGLLGTLGATEERTADGFQGPPTLKTLTTSYMRPNLRLNALIWSLKRKVDVYSNKYIYAKKRKASVFWSEPKAMDTK